MGREGGGVVGVGHAAHHKTAVGRTALQEEIEPLASKSVGEPRRYGHGGHVARMVASGGEEFDVVRIVEVAVSRVGVAIGAGPSVGEVHNVGLLGVVDASQGDACWRGECFLEGGHLDCAAGAGVERGSRGARLGDRGGSHRVLCVRIQADHGKRACSDGIDYG